MPFIGSLEILSNATTENLGLQTKYGIAIGEGPGNPLNWVSLSPGQLLVGTAADPAPSTLIAGSGITITNVPGSITITSTGSASAYPWTPIMGTTTMNPNNGYIPSGGGTVTVNMPTNGAVGDETQVVGNGTMWVINANGNTIHFLSDTVSGTGSLSSTTNYDAVDLLCVAANTYVLKASAGNITTN